MIKDFLRDCRDVLLRRPRSTFKSFKPFLKTLCKLLAPQYILEFGPGISTRVFLSHSNGRILSYETNQDWYDNYHKELASERCDLHHVLDGWNIESLCDSPERYDFIFVDAGDRVRSLIVSEKLLVEEGVVYLHDAHREEYEPGIRTFPYHYFCERHSCLLFKSKAVYEKVKKAMPFDDSCSCHFCRSPERDQYLKKMGV